jgi:hypothetical protein
MMGGQARLRSMSFDAARELMIQLRIYIDCRFRLSFNLRPSRQDQGQKKDDPRKVRLKGNYKFIDFKFYCYAPG